MRFRTGAWVGRGSSGGDGGREGDGEWWCRL